MGFAPERSPETGDHELNAVSANHATGEIWFKICHDYMGYILLMDKYPTCQLRLGDLNDLYIYIYLFIYISGLVVYYLPVYVGWKYTGEVLQVILQRTMLKSFQAVQEP